MKNNRKFAKTSLYAPIAKSDIPIRKTFQAGKIFDSFMHPAHTGINTSR